MNEQQQDKIDEYLLGRMSVEGKKRFEQELLENKCLREQYNYTRLLKETISEYALLQERMSRWDREMEEEQQNEKLLEVAAVSDASSGMAVKFKNLRIWIWISGIAAVLVVGLFVINPFIIKPQLYYSCSSSEEFVANGENDLSMIDSLLINKDFKEALARIEKAEKELYAISFEENQPLSIEQQEQFKSEKQDLKRRLDDLTWLKINAFLGLDRKEEALTLLRELMKGDGYYKEKADSLYNGLN